jgi:hypothetical protein
LITSEGVNETLEVGPKAETIIHLPARVKFQDLFRSVSDFLNKGRSTYRIKGTAQMGFFDLPFDKTGELTVENGKLKSR